MFIFFIVTIIVILYELFVKPLKIQKYVMPNWTFSCKLSDNNGDMFALDWNMWWTWQWWRYIIKWNYLHHCYVNTCIFNIFVDLHCLFLSGQWLHSFRLKTRYSHVKHIHYISASWSFKEQKQKKKCFAWNV